MTTKVVGTFVLFLLAALPALAADFPKIDRTIAKEPAYKNKPKYCLLVFGREAKTQCWLVLDGDVLYVDRNGNRDLTEKGERLQLDMIMRELNRQLSAAGSPDADLPARASYGEIPDRSGKASYRILSFTGHEVGETRAVYLVRIETPGKYCQYTLCSFADEPRRALAYHFSGPIIADLLGPKKLVRGDCSSKIQACIATRTFGPASEVLVESERKWGASALVPKEVHPLAEIAFPAKEIGKMLRIRYALKQRC